MWLSLFSAKLLKSTKPDKKKKKKSTQKSTCLLSYFYKHLINPLAQGIWVTLKIDTHMNINIRQTIYTYELKYIRTHKTMFAYMHAHTHPYPNVQVFILLFKVTHNAHLQMHNIMHALTFIHVCNVAVQEYSQCQLAHSHMHTMHTLMHTHTYMKLHVTAQEYSQCPLAPTRPEGQSYVPAVWVVCGCILGWVGGNVNCTNQR